MEYNSRRMGARKLKIYHFIPQKSYIYKVMKILQAIALLLIISTATAEPLQLFSASTLIDSVSGALTGSLLGGRTIYIKGIGFPTDPNLIQVFIGPFPCKIPADGITQTTLSCQTNTSGGMANILKQPINVIYNQEVYTVPGAVYSYVDSDTPWITDVYPSTAPANTYLSYIGRHRVLNTGDGIRNMGDFIGLYDGTALCGMFDIVQGEITYNGINRVKCLQAREQEAAKYNVSEHVTAGWAYKEWYLRKPSLIKQYYEQTVLPAISSFTPGQGVVTGQDIVIIGTGFSKDKTKVSVSVDGVNCAVTASTLTQINCRLASKQITDTAMLNSDASTPINNYIAGSGFSYTKFNLANLVDKSLNGFKAALAVNSPQLTQMESGIAYELEYQETQGQSNYGQIYKGYFYAPVTGNYIFRGASDDSFSLRISPQYGTTGSSLTEEIFETSATSSGQFYYIANHTTAFGQPRLLQGGKYYYMEVIHINWADYGFFKISVEVPNTDVTLPRKRYQVNQIQTSFTNDPQVMKFTLNSAIGGTFNLSIYRVDPSTLQVTYNKEVTLPFNATAGEFGSAINQFDIYSGYWTSCSQVLAYDSNGVTVSTNSPNATKFEWTVLVYKLRANSLLTQKFTAKLNSVIAAPGSSATFTETRAKIHCPLIDGTFTLTVGGYSVKVYDPVSRSYSKSNIPASINSWDLAAALKQIAGFDKVDVYRSGDPAYGATWIISYMEYSGDVPDLVLSGSMLTGGAPGTTPKVTFFQTRAYSTNIVFNPIDQNFMYQAASAPNLIVTVNSLKSVCLNSCTYTFLPNTPFVTAQTLSGSQVQVTLSNPQNLPYGIDMIFINIAGRPCEILAGGTFTSFTCQLDVNPDGSPTLYAGDYNVDIVVEGLGVIPIQNGVNPMHYQLGISNVSPANGGTNGGYLVTIDGAGFPDNTEEVNLIVCDASPTIVSTTNTKTVFIAPACPSPGQYTITYNYNSQTANTNFTYGTPSVAATLISIYPQSASPVLKAVMTITGTGFGSNVSSITVFLANSTGKVYQMRVLSVNSTTITCGIPGGLPGAFDVKVAIDGQGDIEPANPAVDDFVYELVVSSVTPATVSYYGGTLVTITGKNFSPDRLENLVGIGNELNWLCDVESLTRSQIKCRVPPTHPDWGNRTTQGITVTNRLVQDSVCPSNSCSITYSDLASSPSLTSASVTSISGAGTITLYGTNFKLLPASSVQVVIKNTINSVKTIVPATTVLASSVAFTMPDLQAGFYEVRVRMDPIGETNSLSINVTTTITSSTSTGSVKGGKLTIIGKGLPSEWPSKLFTIKMTNTFYEDVKVLTSTPTKLELAIPEGINNQVHTVIITNPLQQKLTLTFTQLTSSTPSLTLTTSAPLPLSAGIFTFQLTRQSPFATLTPSSIALYQVNAPDQAVALSGWTYSGNAIVVSNLAVKSGKYGFKVYFDGYGYADINGFVEVGVTGSYTAGTVQSSYAGSAITVTGNDIDPHAQLRIGGFTGKVLSQSGSSTTFQIPPLITPLTLAAYPELASIQKITPASILSDNPVPQSYSFDGKHSTYYSSPNSTCYIGFDAGASRLISISRIRYFPYYRWVIASQYILGAVFQASVDGTNYVQVGSVDQTVHAGWNSFQVTNNAGYYRYVRMRHDSTSGCKLSQFQVYGIVYNDVVMTSVAAGYNANAQVWDGKNLIDLGPVVQYRQSATPVITTVNPSTGTIYGNQVVTLTGQNLNIGTGSIFVDQIQCLINAAATTATHLECTTQPRLTLPTSNSFNVNIGLNKAVHKQQFIYVMRWSDIQTWGTDLPPVEGDLVYVPQGMTLMVDQSTPRLDGIVVENGRIVFADESDMEIHTNLITLNGGQFVAGTEKKPYQHKLTFVMYGSYYGKQQPMFGNKGIGCMNCKFSMYGTPRLKTWTVIASTINPGDSTFTVRDTVDWQVGEEIVVASTSFDHNEAEQRTISAVSGNTITVSQPFKNKHLSVVENYGSSDRLEMKAEVGLLTRNIKMMGDPTSEAGEYGSHLMLTGNADSGFVGKVAYTEFTHCGQPRIVGRYCMHFHMAGDVADSYAKGNAVHHSFARVITIHGVHYLQISDNVGYRVKGHNFFIEDGIETQNVIENNLAIGSLESWNMMQTDISVASFWVTNPTNHLRNNRAAGGDFYGFWYEIKTHPDGPSATEDVCPIGNPLGESHDNVAHSYKRFGLRIFKLYSRQSPCDPIRDDSLVDPWSVNPSIQSKFYNYLVYKCGQSGLLAERTGNTIFQNFTLADNKRSGMQFYFTNFTKQLVQARNFAIIGLSQNNADNITVMNNAAGVIAPRTNGWGMSNIRFYNFAAFMNIFQTCSNCENPLLFTNTAHQYMVSGVSYTNVSGSYLKMVGFKRQIIYDTDATFTSPFNPNARTSATIVNNFNHIAQQPGCSPASNPALWDNALVCDQSTPIRSVMFTNLQSQTLFDRTPMKIQLLTDVYDVVANDSTSFTQIFSVDNRGMEPMVDDRKRSYSIAFVAGRVYNIWWLTGLDFTHLNVDVSQKFVDSDPAIIFKFNYTEHREYFELGQLINGQISGNLTSVTINATLDDSLCSLGDYTHDIDNRTMTLCATNRGKQRPYEYLDVVGVRCKYLCPAPPGQYVKQNFIRLWSNATQWPGGVIPQQGENVTVLGQWTVLIDIQPNTMDYLLVKGDVIIPDSMLSVHIKARNIWIQTGTIKAGSSSTPYPGQLTIEIIGNKSDVGIVIDPQIAGNKKFVVTGKLQLYGQTPATSWTKLQNFARPGDTSIIVGSTSGWAVGDEIGIAASFSNFRQEQKVTITAINGNNVSFTPALRYKHYGDTVPTITNAVGTLDTRAGVAHFTRKIKIISGADEGWGFHLLIYGYLFNGTILRSGSAILQGVQLYLGGQYDTENAAVQVLNTVGPNSITIYRSSFTYCRAYCLDIQNINNAVIRENVFYEGRVFLVRANKLNNYIFQNNIMIAAIKRPTLSMDELVACYATYDAIHEIVSSIRGNLCQGSDKHGFVLPYLPCSFVDTPPYSDNTVGSADVGYVFNKISEQCLAGSGAKAYACNIGHIASSPSTAQIIFQKFMIADSNRGATLRFGRESDDNTAYFRNSYISAISRPNCAECYGDSAIRCSGGRGVRMLAVTINGESLPMIFGSGFDVICRQQSFDSKAFLNDIIFQNFNQTYPTLPQCSNNVVFQPHTLASDITGSHHLYNTVCNNCELTALARFTPPLAAHLGWFGGCGRIPCTGKNNYIVADYTGTFLGQPGFLLANNTEIGSKTENCTFIPEINGHLCNRLDFGVLEYESIAPDFNTRIMWPVYLQYDGGLWNTTTNGWRQWDWEGNQPLNHRLARFVSVVQVNKVYNMTFESEPPIDMRLQFQRRYVNGNNSQYIVVKLYYPRPNSIRVQVGGNVIKPISLLDNNGENSIDTSICGSNKFFYQNYTIHFVITAALGCQVRVSLTNSIQLTARFSMDINNFFAVDGQTKFIDRMCAVLGIVDTSRLKIVGIYNGSVTIVAFIDEARATTVDNATQNNNDLQKQQMAYLNTLLLDLYESGNITTELTSAGLGPLLSLQSQTFYHKYDPTPVEEQLTQQQQKQMALYISVSIAAASLIFALVAGVIYYRKKGQGIADEDNQITEVKMEETIVDDAHSYDQH